MKSPNGRPTLRKVVSAPALLAFYDIPAKVVHDNDDTLTNIIAFLTPMGVKDAYLLSRSLGAVSKQFGKIFYQNLRTMDMKYYWYFKYYSDSSASLSSWSSQEEDDEEDEIEFHNVMVQWTTKHKLKIAQLEAVLPSRGDHEDHYERNSTDWMYQGIAGANWSNLTDLNLELHFQYVNIPRSVQFFSLFAQSSQLETLKLRLESLNACPCPGLFTQESLRSVSIVGVDYVEFPPAPLREILQLPRLETLKLSAHCVSDREGRFDPISISSPTLKVLDVAHLMCTEIVEVKCPSLEKLYISGDFSVRCGRVTNTNLTPIRFEAANAHPATNEPGLWSSEVGEYKPMRVTSLPLAEAIQSDKIQLGMDCLLVLVIWEDRYG